MTEHLYGKQNEARHAQPSNPLDKPSTVGESPLEVSVHAYDLCAQFLTCE